jgi:hypothetical protein
MGYLLLSFGKGFQEIPLAFSTPNFNRIIYSPGFWIEFISRPMKAVGVMPHELSIQLHSCPK